MRLLHCSIAAIGLIAVAVQSPSATEGQQLPGATLHLAASPVDDVMPVLYAQRAGLFRQAGLTIVLDRMTNGNVISAAVVGGSVDIGKGNLVPLITAHAHSVPLVVIAPAAVYDPKTPDAVLVTRSDSHISSARDLVGKTVGVTALGDMSEVSIHVWMDANKADWHGTQFIEVARSAVLPALEQGRIQAAMLTKPFINDAVDSGRVKILALTYSSVAVRFLESVWFANRSFVDTHKDAIAIFQRVVAQASEYTNAHQADTVSLLASFTGLDVQQAEHTARIVTGTTLEAREIQPVIDMSAKYHLISKGFDARELMPGQ